MKDYTLQHMEDKINLPTCAVCMENLGTYGGPASLACGHNGCLKCLQELQTHLATPLCPLCRTPFNSKLNLRLNFDLKDTLERMQTTSSVVRYVGSDSNPFIETNGQHKTSLEGQNRYEALRDLALPEETDPWVRVSLTQRGKKECLSSFDYISQEGYSDANRDPGATLPDHSPPEVNLRNVLSGLYTIITGGNISHSDPEEQHEASSELSSEEFIQNDAATLYMGPDLPSAPPLPHLEGNDNLSVPTIFETEPPHWVPDSAASCCMHCGVPFKPLVCGRHHCRFCGGLFCRACSRGKCLLPVKFRERDPQRVCDSCYERLEPLQRLLIRQVSNAAQIAKHDVMDWTCMRGWLNTPLGLSMEQEIYKSSNVLRSYCQIAMLKPERSIPVSVLRGANGLAIFTVAKAGVGITYKLGTGIVIARRENGSWSAPSAIASFGLGWGAQIGGELTDFVIVLRNFEAVKAFSSRVHFSLGGGLSVEAESNWTARLKLAVEEDSMAEDDDHQIPTNSNDEVGVEERTILSPIIEEDSKEMSVEEKLSSESESESEDEGAQDAHVLSLEAAVAENPLSYDTHMEYIKALRKYGHVEKLRNAREAMSALFPLNPMMWQEWTKDEACLITSSEAVSSIEPLYERAVHEYLSVPLWSEYLNFIQERDESVSQCTPEGVEKIRTLFERALTAAGLHVVDGGKLWAAYREFEQALLITMEENSKEVKDKQVDRIRNLFRRQLSVPLSDIDSTLQDYKFWEEQKGTVIGNDTDQLTGLPSNVISGYKRALQMYNARAGYEEKVAGGKHADAELFQNYLSYINFEESSGDPARVQVLYERAITEFPVANDLWLSYTQYLDSNLKVPSIIKSVYSRAVRNCPWVEALWAKYMLALERFDGSEEELSAVFEQSLQCRFSNPNEYLDLFLVRADALRRRIMKMDEISKSSYLALLRETFQRAAEYLSSHLNYTDQFLHLHAYWAQLEYHLGEDLAAARRVWESLIKTSGGMLEVWQGYINMEVSAGSINEARALYKKCYSRRFKDSGSEEICESWLRFEREHGSLDDLDWAVMKVTPRLKELRLFQQQQETKSQEIVEPSSIGQKDVITKSHTKEKDTQQASSKRSNSLQASRKRKTGVGYNDGKDQFKRQKGAQGKGLSYVAPDKEGELGLSNRDDKERDTVSRELVDREANQQTEVANLDSSEKPVYTDQCTVFLSNLSLEVTEEQLRRFFSDTGGVVAIRLLRDRFSGKPRGLAYVDFENEEKLSSAVEKNRQKLLGKRISIARSNPKQSQRERSGRGYITGGRGGRALSGRGSGTRTDERHGSSAQSASPAVSNRHGGHVKLTGSNTFALPRNVARAARPLGWGVKDNRSIEAEETPKSNEEFRKFLLKS